MTTVFFIERRRKSDVGFRKWFPVSDAYINRDIAQSECDKLNTENSVFEYTVTEKPK